MSSAVEVRRWHVMAVYAIGLTVGFVSGVAVQWAWSKDD